MVEETVPDFRLPASTGQTLELGSFLGKVPIVFTFLDSSSERHLALLGEINGHLQDFGGERSQILVIMRLIAREVRELAEEGNLAVPILADASGAMARSFEVAADDDSAAVAIVADKDGRVVRRFDPLPDEGDPAEIVESLLYSVRAIGSGYVAPET